MSLKIVFQNEAFVVVDKPSGWLSVPSRMGQADSRPCVLVSLSSELKQKLSPVHRLDVEVGGLLLFALQPDSHREANQWFETKGVRKRYEAWTEKSTTPVEGTFRWESRLVRGKKRTFEAAYGKPSVTEARIVRQTPEYLVWEVSPLTGRSHQIRFELAKHGYPILGDKLYGAKSPWQPEGIALRAVELDFSEIPPEKRFGLPENIKVLGLFAKEK